MIKEHTVLYKLILLHIRCVIITALNFVPGIYQLFLFMAAIVIFIATYVFGKGFFVFIVNLESKNSQVSKIGNLHRDIHYSKCKTQYKMPVLHITECKCTLYIFEYSIALEFPTNCSTYFFSS